ncbi:MAG: hypothetical protein Ta2F_06240 [Termitinemataceae bacterium]|nr:MAG: hypothetical protein Ta2F_06240 [Termitinemataceae bacterium]
MKKYNSVRALTLYCVFYSFFMFISIVHSNAQNILPFQKLFCVQTEHFDIIYPAKSRIAAYKLAERADAMYENVSAMLGISIDKRVPVTITPNTDEHNGYMNPVPYLHIMLFDTYEDPDWGVFKNSLEGLFLHEMTHAVSGNSKSNAAKGLSKVFGGWVNPLAFTAPWFMIEGVSVSFESLDGTGRSNDPLVRQKLRQDSYENNFRSPFAAEGVYDLPPGGNVHYYYGGLFNTYLQKTYGMEKYSLLWQEMGRKIHPSIFKYNSGFYYVFKKVYGIDIQHAWFDFEKSLKLDDIADNTDGIILGGKRQIKDIAAAANGKIYFIDNVHSAVIEYDPASRKMHKVISTDYVAYSIDISYDSKNILLSTYNRWGANAGQLSRAVAVEYRIKNGFKTGRRWKGLYNARYFNDGVIGIAGDLHNSNLVYRKSDDKKGEKESVLLEGNEELIFTDPVAINDHVIAFISAQSGKRNLTLLNTLTNQTSVFQTQDNSKIFTYIRGLRYNDGKLIFAYNDNDKMYKVGYVNIDNKISNFDSGSFQAYLSTKEFSGGVLNPVISNEKIFYKAAFTVWDALMEYPTAETTNLQKELKLTVINATRIVTSMGTLPDNLKEKTHFPFRAFNPLNLWVPYPVINPIVSSIYYDGTAAFKAQGNFKDLHIDGAGLFFFASGPTDDNLFFVNAAYDNHYKTALLGLTWYNFSLTFPIVINFKDTVDESTVQRILHADINASKRFPLGNERRALTLGASFSGWWYFYQDTIEMKTKKTKTAYQWDLKHQFLSYGASATLSNIKKFNWEIFGSGLSNQVYISGIIDIIDINNTKKTPHKNETHLRYSDLFTAAIEEIPFLQGIPVLRNFSFKNTVYGLYDKNGINIQGRSKYYSGAIFSDSAPTEYAPAYQNYYPLTWMIGGQADWKMFSWELQNNITHVYFNRLSIGAAYRWAYYGNQNMSGTSMEAQNSNFIHSALLRGSLVVSVAPIKVLPLKLTFNVLGAVKLSALNKGNTNDDFYAGFTFGMQY